MNHQPSSPVEQAYLRAIATGASMTRRLEMVAEAARVHRPEYTRLVDDFVKRLESVRAGHSTPAVGDHLPSFTLPDQDGHFVKLEELLGSDPVVVAFHRGHWCPYCRLNMIGLSEVAELVAPARIVTISTETQRYSKALKGMASADFPFLTDVAAGYALQLGLAIWIDPGLAQLIASVGWDVPAYQGGTDWIMPMPSVFVLDRDGVIRARHIDRDYRRRMDMDELVAAVRAVD